MDHASRDSEFHYTMASSSIIPWSSVFLLCAGCSGDVSVLLGSIVSGSVPGYSCQYLKPPFISYLPRHPLFSKTTHQEILAYRNGYLRFIHREPAGSKSRTPMVVKNAPSFRRSCLPSSR